MKLGEKPLQAQKEFGIDTAVITVVYLLSSGFPI